MNDKEMHVVMEKIHRYKKKLHNSILHLHQQQRGFDPSEGTMILNHYPLSEETWDILVLENSKSSFLITFDIKISLREHISTINIKMAIIGVIDSFKCKFVSRSFK